jgi:hypothetical protein
MTLVLYQIGPQFFKNVVKHVQGSLSSNYKPQMVANQYCDIRIFVPKNREY